ncbi:MAG: CAP domain-containing protein [Thiotrichaceae bacterium]|nr:CAP domain-containing protein [Thiotrichaceae bacterium]
MYYLQRITPNHLLVMASVALSLLLLPFATWAASGYDQELLKLTNAERAKYDMSALALSSKLGQAAQKHALDMAAHNYFSHTGRNGSKGGERVEDEGYEYSRRGENIAAGHATPEETMSQWMNSKVHRANILNSKFTEIGFGYAADDSSKYEFYWVQVFATPKEDSSTNNEGSSTNNGTDDSNIESLVWQTSKATALQLAKQQSKRVLLIADREACEKEKSICPLLASAAVLAIIEQSYILWYSDRDESKDYGIYDSGLSSYRLPLIAIIDPNNTDEDFIARKTGHQTDNDEFAQWLQKYVGSDTPNQPPIQTNVELKDKAVALFNVLEIILEEYIQPNSKTESNGDDLYYRLYDNIYGLGVYKDGFYIGVNHHGEWDWTYIATLDEMNSSYCAPQCW